MLRQTLKTASDFSTMEHKLETNQYPFLTAMVDDFQLVFDNCRTYNPEGSVYHKQATKLDKIMRELVDQFLRDA